METETQSNRPFRVLAQEQQHVRDRDCSRSRIIGTFFSRHLSLEKKHDEYRPIESDVLRLLRKGHAIDQDNETKHILMSIDSDCEDEDFYVTEMKTSSLIFSS